MMWAMWSTDERGPKAGERKRERDGGRDGGWEGGREGGREGGKEGGRPIQVKFKNKGKIKRDAELEQIS